MKTQKSSINQLIQKHFFTPQLLTDEEWEILKYLKEEDTYNETIVEIHRPSFEETFISIYGTPAGLEVIID